MHHEDIKAEMRKRGVTPADLAAHLEVSQNTVSRVIRGLGTSRRVADAIAKLIEKPVKEIWPGVYEPARRPDLSRLLGTSASRTGASRTSNASRRKAAA